MAIVLNARGTPEPPTSIVDRLRRVHPALGLRYMGIPGRPWNITWEWPELDGRWARVRSGEIGAESAYDIIGHIPEDCPVDEAAPYLERALRGDPRNDISSVVTRMHHYNNTLVPAQQVEAVFQATMDDVAATQRQKNPRRTKIPKAE